MTPSVRPEPSKFRVNWGGDSYSIYTRDQVKQLLQECANALRDNPE